MHRSKWRGAGGGLAVLWMALIPARAADLAELQARRARAMEAMPEGVLLVHANRTMAWNDDSFRQDPVFYYFTGLENTVGALLALDGRTKESWLFLPREEPSFLALRKPPVEPGTQAQSRLGVAHVVEAGKLPEFLEHAGKAGEGLYYLSERASANELPTAAVSAETAGIPLWVRTIAEQGHFTQVRDATSQIYSLMEVQGAMELSIVRAAAHASAQALRAGLQAIRPGISERVVETTVVTACWVADVHGTSFWPWAMSGPNAAFPKTLESLGRYDHLERVMRSGELVRLDIGCEAGHYQGDVGRTAPVSGRFDKNQRETWNVFVAAYQAGVKVLRPGATEKDVFEAWRAELLRQKDSVGSEMAKKAIALWADRANVPFWELHTTGLVVGLPTHGLREGMTIDFEPIAVIEGQGFYLEDMFLITKDGAEVLTQGLPYTAEEIEKAMKR